MSPAPASRPVALAVDLGGTKVDAALVDADGAVRAASVHRAATGRDASRDAISAAIAEVARRALAALADGDALVGVGIGSAGPVDLDAGTVSPLNLPAIAGLPIVELLAGISPGIPIRLALDGTCIALAEHWRGAAAGTRNALAMIVSTGVGGGIIIDGMPVRGQSGNAGHVGQLRLRAREAGAPVTDGTLEARASGTASVAWAQAHGWSGRTGEDLAASYAEGDPIAVAAVRRSAQAVGEAIASAATLLDLEVAVVAGGFANVSPDYLDLVRESVAASAVFDYARRVRVAPTGLDGYGPLIGAGALVLAGSGGTHAAAGTTRGVPKA